MSGSVTATFVFTDLVDSTATSARLGPEAADRLRQTHFRVLRGAVAESGGTEVKNLGDGLMVVFWSPSRALACAVGMLQAIEQHNRSATDPLLVRIGVSTGEATEDEGDYFGDPVVEAARLSAAADGGQILATEVVRMMVARHATQSFAAVGPLELKGLPEPVAAVEVLWEPAAVEGAAPLPGRLQGAATDARFGFFGRAVELGRLEDARKAAAASRRCQVVFISGEAGMGKTALAAQLARAVHAAGAIVLFGHADEDLGASYQPWIGALSSLVRFGDPEVVDSLRPAPRRALARLVPDIGSSGERVTDPETERLLMFDGVTELLAASSLESSVFVVLDDLHWADAASLQLLRHVITSATPMDVTIACTYRDTDLSRGDPLTKLLADMHREANVSRVPLSGLDDHELVELVAAASGHDLDDDGVELAHSVCRETDGNPFFTTELIRHLRETGAIVLGEGGTWTPPEDLSELGLPNSVRDVVGRRVERLGAEAVPVLSLAAVVGREFDVDLLAGLSNVDVDPLLDLLDAAVDAALLEESNVADRYRFAHGLIQHSLYEEMSPSRRQRAHRQIADALEARTTSGDAATLAELAHHWVAATRQADLDRAVTYVRRAGDAARDALAPDDAIRWYEQALDLLGDQDPGQDQTRADLLAALGTVQRLAAHPDARDTFLRAAEVAERLGADDVLVDAALGFTQWAGAIVGDGDAQRVIGQALDRIGPDPTPIRAKLLAGLASAHDATIESDVRGELSLQAVDVARRAGDDTVFVDVIGATLYSLAVPERRDQLIDDLSDAVAMADRTGDPVLQARIRFQMMWTRYQQADLAGADAVLAELEALVDTLGLPHQHWQLARIVTGRLLLAGRADEAEAANDRALELGSSAGAPEALGVAAAALAFIREHQGRIDEVVDFFLDVVRDNPSIAALRSGIPAMLCELGRIDEAHERLVIEAADDFDYPLDGSWLSAMTQLTDAAATTGDHAAARTLVDRIGTYAEHVISPAAVLVCGVAARPLARAATLLRDYDQAEAWFAIAHDLHARLQAPFWTSMGQLDHADLCVARQAPGDLRTARELVTTASAIAATHGCAGLTERASVLLADL